MNGRPFLCDPVCKPAHGFNLVNEEPHREWYRMERMAQLKAIREGQVPTHQGPTGQVRLL